MTRPWAAYFVWGNAQAGELLGMSIVEQFIQRIVRVKAQGGNLTKIHRRIRSGAGSRHSKIGFNEADFENGEAIDG